MLWFNGGSKPPPYHVVVCFVSFATAFGCLSLTMQLLLFRKNHARLACSVVNALTTAHCRYKLLRITGQPQGLSLRLCEYFNIISAINYHISTTIQRRQQATALHRGMLNSHSRATAFQPPLCKGRCRTNVRRRDCKVDFIWFCKNPSVIFLRKTTAPFTREP